MTQDMKNSSAISGGSQARLDLTIDRLSGQALHLRHVDDLLGTAHKTAIGPSTTMP